MKSSSKNRIHISALVFMALMMILIMTSCGNKNRNIQASSDNRRFDEPYRPQYHFTPDSMWMNDPNGLFYLDGIYHLFYQYHPYSTQWGSMHWGHAISRDLLHWEHLPIALYPDSLGTIFSGSAVVDRFNTSGLGTGKEVPVIAVFTINSSTGLQSQGIAYSNDKGMTWTKYSANPVLPNTWKKDFRDPKVFWHEESKHWIMVLAVGDHVEIYRSTNLKEWEYASSFGKNDGCHAGVWECPDLFMLKVPGSTVKMKWILMVSTNAGGPNGGSGIQYFIGTFNGTKFVNENYPEGTRWIDYGPDDYAGSTWSGIPGYDGRRIFSGWMTNLDYCGAIPTTVWRGSQTLPRRLRLVQTKNGLKVASFPVKEIKTLYENPVTKGPETISGYVSFEYPSADLSQSYINLDLLPDSVDRPSKVGIRLTSTAGDTLIIGYNISSGYVFIDRSRCGENTFSEKFYPVAQAPVIQEKNNLCFDIYTDRSSIECFVNGGTRVLTCRIFPKERLSNMEVFSIDGTMLLKEAGIQTIKNTITDIK